MHVSTILMLDRERFLYRCENPKQSKHISVSSHVAPTLSLDLANSSQNPVHTAIGASKNYFPLRLERAYNKNYTGHRYTGPYNFWKRSTVSKNKNAPETAFCFLS